MKTITYAIMCLFLSACISEYTEVDGWVVNSSYDFCSTRGGVTQLRTNGSAVGPLGGYQEAHEVVCANGETFLLFNKRVKLAEKM